MMRSLLVLLVFSAQACADCDIKVHIPNIKPGCCAWASLETIGRHLGYEDLHGLAQWYVVQGPSFGETDFKGIKRQLAVSEVAYDLCTTGDLDFLRRAAQRGLPALIGFKKASPLGAHACVFKNIDETHVFFYDCNHPAEVFRYSIEDFIATCDGWFLVVEPRQAK